MDRLFLILLLLAIFVLLPVALFFGLRRSARRWIKRHPDGEGARVLTATGFALYGCFIALLVLGFAARQLEPAGPLGRFLSTSHGEIAGFIFAWMFFAIADAVLKRIGYPTTRKRLEK